jgi:hypothetical protein
VPPIVDKSNLNRENLRLGIARTVVIQALVLLALAGAAVWYVNWSSAAALSEFMNAGKPPVSGLNLHPQSQAPIQAVHAKAICARKIQA